jgi:hypothetical protein
MRLLQVIMGNKSWSFVLSSKAAASSELSKERDLPLNVLSLPLSIVAGSSVFVIRSGLASLTGSTVGLLMLLILQISARTLGDLGDEPGECSDAECGRMPALSVFSGGLL